MSIRPILPAARAAVGLMLILLSCGAVGCASYATPGRAADFKAMGLTRDQLTDVSISETLSKQPLVKFPCGIAAVRIQAPGYKSATAEGWGTGKYSVITTLTHEVENTWRGVVRTYATAQN